MSKDLEETLNELGPDYRAVVGRLRVGGEPSSVGIIGGRRGPTYVWLTWNPRALVAASLLVLIGLTVVHLSQSQTSNLKPQTSSCPREYRASVDEMIATQNPDGSWQNDFLTRRNAEALKVCGDPAARIAYKKAVRNLRSRGML